MPKYVVSKTLKKAEWNNSHIISENVVEEIKKLKKAKEFPGVSRSTGTILIAGSGQLVRFLLEHNMVDQVNILLYPVVLGTGKQLFANIKKKDLKLVESEPFSSGIVKLIYVPANK